MLFKYEAYDTAGELVTGVVEADSQDRAEEALWQSNLTVSNVSKVLPKVTIDQILPSVFGVKRQDLVIFSRDLASLIGAGIPLLAALRMLHDQTGKAALRRVIGEVLVSLETGSSFSQACAKHPTVFPPLFLRIVEIGEEIGSLEMVLRQVTVHYEKEMALMNSIRKALTYPIFVAALSVASIFVMVNFVVPAMMGLFNEFKAELPLATRILIAVAGFLKVHGVQVIAGIAALVIGLYMYTKTPAGNRRKDYFLLALPVIGQIGRKLNIGRIARTMVILQRAGVPLTEALKVLIPTTQNAAFRDALGVIEREVRQGKPLSQAFSMHPLFTPLLIQMVSVGEQTGRLETNLETLANYYEQESDRSIARLTELIEPILILGAGGLVGFIAISIITPMYGIIHQIK